MIKVMTIATVAMLVATGISAAQTTAQAPRAPTSEEMSVGVNWNNLQQSLGSMLQSLDKVIRENDALKLHNADMDAYLKACGDAPGCTSPAK